MTAGALPTARYCGSVPQRQSTNTAWPLRAADGRTFAERAALRASNPPSSPRT